MFRALYKQGFFWTASADSIEKDSGTCSCKNHLTFVDAVAHCHKLVEFIAEHASIKAQILRWESVDALLLFTMSCKSSSQNNWLNFLTCRLVIHDFASFITLANMLISQAQNVLYDRHILDQKWSFTMVLHCKSECAISYTCNGILMHSEETWQTDLSFSLSLTKMLIRLCYFCQSLYWNMTRRQFRTGM